MATPDQEDEDARLPEALRATLLLNETRSSILALLKAKPGLNRHQISKMLGVNANTVRFHVRRLERQDFVVTRKLPKVRETFCFLAEDAELWDDSVTRSLLGRETTRDIALFLVENLAVSAREIADALDISVFSVRRHIRALDDQDLVTRLRIDRQVLYHAEPDLVDWAEEAKKRCGLLDEVASPEQSANEESG